MESAQLRMERMLPELRDLEQKKLFTKTEISAIVAQRQLHEASIARPRSHEPYLQYIDYERRLERLRRLRLGRLVGPNAKKSKARITVSDYSIPLHILNLFSSAVKRFPESRVLWLAYITYALTQPSPKLISRVLSASIAAHPSHPDFWVMAAQFESDGDQNGKGGGNVDGARKLLMRGLRFLRGEDGLSLWKEWIRIELNFIQAMTKRREVLGISNQTKQMVIKDVNDEEGDDEMIVASALQTTMQLDQLREETDEPNPIASDVIMTQATGQEALQSGSLVKVVLSNAFKSMQTLSIFDVAISLLNEMDLPIKSSLLDFAYSTLEELHPELPRARVMIATRGLLTNSQADGTFAITGLELVNTLARTVKDLQSICKTLLTSDMWEEYLSFLIDTYSKLTDEDLRLYVSTTLKKTISSLRLKNQDSVRSHELVLSHHLITSSRPETLQASEQACIQFPNSLSLCLFRLKLYLDISTDPSSQSDSCLQIFQDSQIRFPDSIRVAELYVQMVQQAHSRNAFSHQRMQELYETSLDRASKRIHIPVDVAEPSDDEPHPPLLVVEVYQRALVNDNLSDLNTSSSGRKSLYLQLARRSTLSLNFLTWSTTHEKDLIALEYLHTLTISHPRASLDEWFTFLKFLVMVKKEFREAEAQLDQAKRRLGIKMSSVLETRWMKLLET